MRGCGRRGECGRGRVYRGKSVVEWWFLATSGPELSDTVSSEAVLALLSDNRFLNRPLLCRIHGTDMFPARVQQGAQQNSHPARAADMRAPLTEGN